MRSDLAHGHALFVADLEYWNYFGTPLQRWQDEFQRNTFLITSTALRNWVLARERAVSQNVPATIVQVKSNCMRRDRQLVVEFVQAYNFAHGSAFSIESWPEDERRNTPAVEAIARDGDRHMAIEHTLAQPFVGERNDSAIFRRVVEPIETDESLLVQGFDVTVSTDVGAIPTGVNWDTTASAIRKWLRRELPNLPEGRAWALPSEPQKDSRGLLMQIWA